MLATRAGVVVPRSSFQAPRPCVPATSSARDESYDSCSTWTAGSEVPTADHDGEEPLTFATNAPKSVPAMSSLPSLGLSTSVLTGPSGRLPVTSAQCAPPSVVLNTWPAWPGVAAL